MIKQIFRQLGINFRKDKLHTILNIVGLSLGLTVCMLAILYAQMIFSFDGFHKNIDRLYRFGISMTIGSSPTSTQEGCNPGTGPILKQAIPGIEEFTRTLYLGDSRVIIDEAAFKETGFALMWADNSIFRLFTFPMIVGDPNTALERPHTIVLTRELALKYFGTTDVLGKMVKVENSGDFEVTGVVQTMPANNGLPFTALLSMITINSLNPGDYRIDDLTSNMGSSLFFIFSKGFQADDFKNAFEKWYKENMASVDAINCRGLAEPFKDFYLHSFIYSDFSARNRMVLTGFLSIGLLLLIIACFNYINLTTSRSEERAKEIGIRKISGASQRSLRIQLLGESVISTFISMIIALGICEFLLNLTKVNDMIVNLNSMVGVRLSIDLFHNPVLLISVLTLPILIGILAGAYPAFLMSNMSPVSVIKSARGGVHGKSFLRGFLIIVQFTISIGAIMLSLLMNQQITKISNIDPGFNKKDLLYVTCRDQSAKSRFKLFRERIATYADVRSTSFSDRSPGMSHFGLAYEWQKESGEMEIYPAVFVATDNDYFKTLGINIIRGSGFLRPRQPSDTLLSFLVTESFVKALGWKEPIGKVNSMGSTIGVVNDFHYNALTDPLRPMFIRQYREDRTPDILNIRINSDRVEATVDFLHKTWKETIPEVPFDLTYAEDLIDQLYAQSRTQGIMTNWLGMICLLISCFGLLSYSSYIAFRKKKEFVIRKVAGASSLRIFTEFSAQILKIILISSIPAILGSLVVYHAWSRNFVYNPPLSVWIIVLSVLGMMLLALITSAYHVLQASRINPVENLKVE